MTIEQEVNNLYEKYPFPNDNIQSKNDVQIHKWILNSLSSKIPQGSKILDLGCGTGDMSIFLSDYGEVIGYDFSNNSLKIAKDNVSRLGLDNVKFKKLDITKESFGKFDYIFCIGVLHHIPQKEKALENIKKMMHKETILIISVYSKWAVKLGKRKAKDGDTNHARFMDTFKHPYETFYGQKEFERYLESNGFEVLKTWRDMPDIVRLITGRGEMMTYSARLINTNL